MSRARNSIPSRAQVLGWKTTAIENAPHNLPQDPQGSSGSTHGYTLADIDQAARSGIARSYGWHANDAEERFAVSRLAVLEHLYAATERPPFHDLVNEAWLADHQFVVAEMREHGVNRAERGGGTTTSFERYWWAAGANIPSPESSIVERFAVRQIMPLLTPKQTEAVTAVAAFGDYKAAADALGVKASALDMRLKKARETFKQAWHSPETPRRETTRDRRVWSRTGTGPDGRRRLTESEVQHIRERHLAGELVRDMAAEAGITRQALHALLRGARRPAADTAGA